MDHENEDYFPMHRRDFKKERRLATSKDRSKYKKSDQDQLKKRAENAPVPENCEKGRVVALTPDGILVDSNQKIYTCTLRGSLKQEQTKVKTLIAVGDIVHFESLTENEGAIYGIDERLSFLSRTDPVSGQHEQLIAVNVDQAIIVASVVLPPLKPSLIDRYIIAARKGNIEPVIVVNKIDMMKNPPDLVDPEVLAVEKNLYSEFIKAYSCLNISVIATSVTTGEGIESLRQQMRGKTSVFSGQSGVGKSSLINAIAGTSLRVGEIVSKTRKGAHTTSATYLVPLEGGGYCVDTPGVKSFGLTPIDPYDVQSFFPDILEWAQFCRFPDCHHLHEPDCAVKEAYLNGKISRLRFESYLGLMEGLEKDRRRQIEEDKR